MCEFISVEGCAWVLYLTYEGCGWLRGHTSEHQTHCGHSSPGAGSQVVSPGLPGGVCRWPRGPSGVTV